MRSVAATATAPPPPVWRGRENNAHTPQLLFAAKDAIFPPTCPKAALRHSQGGPKAVPRAFPPQLTPRIPLHGIKGFVTPTKSFVKIGITKIFCYNKKMFSSINKTFGCCSKIFGCSNKKFICCP